MKFRAGSICFTSHRFFLTELKLAEKLYPNLSDPSGSDHSLTCMMLWKMLQTPPVNRQPFCCLQQMHSHQTGNTAGYSLSRFHCGLLFSTVLGAPERNLEEMPNLIQSDRPSADYNFAGLPTNTGVARISFINQTWMWKW